MSALRTVVMDLLTIQCLHIFCQALLVASRTSGFCLAFGAFVKLCSEPSSPSQTEEESVLQNFHVVYPQWAFYLMVCKSLLP